MNVISNIITEASRSEEFLQKEINRYLKAMGTKLPKRVQAALYIINKYPSIQTKEDIEDIRDGSLKIYSRLEILPDDLKELQKILKSLGKDIKLLPHFLNAHQRQALEQNKLSAEDITLDIESKQGRENTARKYMPLVLKIAGQFDGQTSMSKDDLIACGLEGLVNAMNSYKTSEELELEKGKTSTQTFGQYAAYQIRFAILNAINEYGSLVGQSDYLRRKEGGTQVSSVDATYGQDEEGDEIKIDRLLNLSEEPDYDLKKETEKRWVEVFKKLEKRFSARDCNIFYRAFGVNGFEKEEGKTIARSLNVSGPAVSQTIKKIIDFLKQSKDTIEVLRELFSIYECNLLSKLITLDKEMIQESLLKDDIYVIIETLERWKSGAALQTAINKSTDFMSVDDALFIYKCLDQDINFLESNLKKNKKVIITFLNNLYPAESFNRKSEGELLDYMKEIIDCGKNFKIKW